MKVPDRQDFNRQRLVLARTLRGVSKAELARDLGVSRQFIHQLEAGDRRPPSDLIRALAAHLRVEDTFLAGAEHSEIRRLHFRRRAKETKRNQDRAFAHAQVLDLLLTHLGSVLVLPAARIPVLARAEDIEAAADDCRTFWGIRRDAPIGRVIRVLENVGIPVGCAPRFSEDTESFSYSTARIPAAMMILDEVGSPTRRRFSLAHELGHLVLHRSTARTKDERQEQEKGAHQFASAFLMPRVGFYRDFHRSAYLDWEAIFRLKARWGTSAPALLRRAWDLGLIDYQQYRSGNIHVRASGWTRSEPGEPEWERPELLPTAIDVLERDAGLGLDSVAAAIGLLREDIEDIVGVGGHDPGSSR